MFSNKITLKHSSGITKEVEYGWSLSPFFFGPIPHILYGAYAYGFVMLIVSIILAGMTMFLGNIFLNIYLMSNLNRKIIEGYLLKGYEFSGDNEDIAKAKEYVSE